MYESRLKMLLTRSMSIQSDVSREIFIQKRDGAHSNTERYYGLWLVEVQDYETIGMLCIPTSSKNFQIGFKLVHGKSVCTIKLVVP